jgi:hypothetical protein
MYTRTHIFPIPILSQKSAGSRTIFTTPLPPLSSNFFCFTNTVSRPNVADCPLYENPKDKQPRIEDKPRDETIQESR